MIWGVSGESSLNSHWRGSGGIPSTTLSFFFYSLSSQITCYLGCLHSGSGAKRKCPLALSVCIATVPSHLWLSPMGSPWSQLSLPVPLQSLEPSLQGDAGPAAVALPDPCASPGGWGQIHLSVLSVPALPSPGELQPLESHPCLTPTPGKRRPPQVFQSGVLGRSVPSAELP